MSSYLLDSHTFLRAVDGEGLPEAVQSVILRTENRLYLNMASIWEMEHCLSVRSLPLHHRDPFGRMPVAQCLVEDLTLVSNGQKMDAYGIRQLW